MPVVLQQIAVYLMTFFATLGAIFQSAPYDSITLYKNNVKAVEEYENTIETAVPQTKIHDLIEEHFNSPLPEGKTEKKVIVIGYDGCRADALTFLDDAHEGGMSYLLSTGGKVELAYAGGANYPLMNTQHTSTGPGWCAMLTGKWGTETGVTNNDIIKPVEYKTNLVSLIEDGTIDSSAFYVSWNGHFVSEKSTYKAEKEYAEKYCPNAKFVDAADDNGTVANILNDLARPDCSDYIFTTIEYTDHAGHSTGFNIALETYKQAFRDNEKAGRTIIDAVEGRPTYETEDWLILMTTDHGGINTGHGGSTLHERMTYIASRRG